LFVSGAMTLVALGLMVWSMLVPTPLPVMLAMTVGQAIGTTAFALYIFVVLRDLRRDRRARRDSLRDMARDSLQDMSRDSLENIK